jgi:6-pyruvoyltetrahydropterin/6-carboxytetrahydropterin synthase
MSQTMRDSSSNSPAPRAYLSRRYRLSASHRLHTEAFTPEENQSAYGKCNNPHGHGHNYVIEVTFAGPVDRATGMICDLGALDAFARERLLDRFDCRNLNTMPEFQACVSTTENFTREVHRIFSAFPQAELTGIRIEETSNNSFESHGADSNRKAERI